MCECVCRCVKGVYKGLEFKFTASGFYTYERPNSYALFFKDLRQLSDFIIKFFLNAYEEKCVEMNVDGTYCVITSPSIEIERVVI